MAMPSTSSTHWNLLAAWSKAGVGTSLVLELKTPPQTPGQKASPRIAFDIGATPCFDEAIPAKYVFVSHGHLDHVGAMFSHARAHAVTCGGSTPTYFVPAQLLPQIEQCRDAMSALDASNAHPENGGGRNRSLIKMNLVPVRPGDEVLLKGIGYGPKTSFFARAIEVDHAGHPALGYIIGSRTASGLKEEYRHLDGPSIRDLAKAGVPVKADPVERIEVAYTGDTCARGLLNNSPGGGPGDVGQLFRAELLLCELTYLDSGDDEEKQRLASERGHLHINDLEGIFASHRSDLGAAEPRPQCIVFYHLSAKYQPAARALDLMAKGPPLDLRDRCHVAISSMLGREKQADADLFAQLIRPNGCISLAEYVAWKTEAA
ncbi:hypothetical protein ACHAXT_012920 [Thalassiosira profunda]